MGPHARERRRRGIGGATPQSSIEELANAVDTVIVMLWGDDAARDVTLGRVIPAMYGTLEDAALAREIAFLAAPVLGSVGAVAQGSITILPGGRRESYERAQPLLKSLGKTVTYTGSVRASGVRGGVDRALAVDSIDGAFGRIAASKRQQLLDRDTEPRFTLDALLKDLLLAREAARSLQVDMPMLETVLPPIEHASAEGLGDRGYIVVAVDPVAIGP